MILTALPRVLQKHIHSLLLNRISLHLCKNVNAINNIWPTRTETNLVILQTQQTEPFSGGILGKQC